MEFAQLRFDLRTSRPARVHRFALETVSQSEGGQERVYQGSVLVPTWAVALEPGEKFEVEFVATVGAVG